MNGTLRFVVLEDGDTYGGADGSNIVLIDADDPGLDEAYESEDAAQYLFEHGRTIALGALIEAATLAADPDVWESGDLASVLRRLAAVLRGED